MQTSSAETLTSKWYQDWQTGSHTILFDSRSRLPARSLVRRFESFSDVRLLRRALLANPQARLLEVGCATGEFYRYLRIRHPGVHYAGVDISRAAVERARQRFPEGSFHLIQPDVPLGEGLREARLARGHEVVYSKDVVHHQTDPFGFLGGLLDASDEALVVRLRTRDRGATVIDPERSCQYHYEGWMPYLVLNTEELVGFIRDRAPESELVVCRSYQVLGGRENRYLPRECYLAETGTAETSVAIFRKTGRPGRVSFEDGPDGQVPPPLRSRIKERVKRLLMQAGP